MNHDKCRRTNENPWVGQNLAYVYKYGSFYNDTDAIEESVQMWYDENTLTTWADMAKLPSDL